jgi:multidrug efflux pump subunit AcrA (membrane-fusion protein)
LIGVLGLRCPGPGAGEAVAYVVVGKVDGAVNAVGVAEPVEIVIVEALATGRNCSAIR